jgi:hypothetical protein
MRKGIPLIIYLDNDLSSWLQKMRDDEGYPKSALVRLALREYRARYDRKTEGGKYGMGTQ